MFLVGLTGGIASGKSVVAERFAQHGAEVIDADDIARAIVLPGTPAWSEIREHFGPGVLDDDSFIDRAALGRIVFADESKRVLLNEITHPRIFTMIADRLEVLAPFDGVVVLDVPLLVESGIDRAYDAIVVVASRRETQLERLVDDRSMSEPDALARIDAQGPLEDKLDAATHVLWNEGSLAELEAEADRLAAQLVEAARKKAESALQGLPDD